MNILDYLFYFKILILIIKDYDYRRYHLVKYKTLIKEFDELVKNNKLELNDKKKWKQTFLQIGATPKEYYLFDLKNKNKNEIDSYVTLFRQYYKVVCFLNKNSDITVLNDKARFNYHFSKFLGRDWLDISKKDISKNEIDNFLKEHDEVVLKPIKDSCGGKGIEFIKTKNIDIEKYLNGNYICESVIKQNGVLHEINPNCVNTVRIVTIKKGDKIDVCLAVLRTSNGLARVDNHSFGGMVIDIDYKTGKLNGYGYDQYGNRFYNHPTTNKSFDGIKINNWNNAIKTVVKAHKTIDVNYVGWDVVINADSIFLIEANHDSDLQGFQKPDCEGYWTIIKKYLK